MDNIGVGFWYFIEKTARDSHNRIRDNSSLSTRKIIVTELLSGIHWYHTSTEWRTTSIAASCSRRWQWTTCLSDSIRKLHNSHFIPPRNMYYGISRRFIHIFIQCFLRFLCRMLLRKVTKTNKALYHTFITTYGVAHNLYSGIVQSEVTMEDLFDSTTIFFSDCLIEDFMGSTYMPNCYKK